MRNFRVLLTIILVLGSLLSSDESLAQRKLVQKPKPISGSESHSPFTSDQRSPIYYQSNLQLPPLRTMTGTVLFSSTPSFTVYDLQSNAVSQQIWQDPITPSNVHAVFMYSTVPGFATRSTAYFFSNDFGTDWNFLGDVPGTGRSGFPAISGFANGAAVVINHNNTNGTTTHAKINYDQGAGFGVFTELNPGVSAEGDPIWGRLVCLPNNSVVFAASINGAVFSYINRLTNISPPGTFSGFQTFSGDQAETYWLALAPNGTIGHAFIGSDNEDPNDVFYRSSADGGVTWTAKQRIWDWNIATDSLGCLRGVSMVFGNNNQPYVTFNTSLLTESGFFPESPSQIRVWSPTINGGIPKIIASAATIPFYPNQGSTSDAFLPICRPAIGRSSSGSGVCVAFVATTGQVGSDTSSYYAAWITYSTNDGVVWNTPERMTPQSPLRDWRFISVSPTNNIVGNTWTIQMACQSDSLAGTHVNGAPIGVGQLVGIRFVTSLNTTPASPTLISPSHGALNVSLTPTLTWGSVSGAISYRLQIATDSLFSSPILNNGNITTNTFVVPSSTLNFQTKYYWRVNATNSIATGPWSSVWDFTTISNLPPATPVLLSPANGSDTVGLTPILDWFDAVGANSYRLMVATDSNFNSVILDVSNISSSNYNVPSPYLTYLTKYYWRVNATNGFGNSPWSTAWNFRTRQMSPPSIPILLSPANNATGVTLTPLFDWQNSTNVTYYRLNLATDLNFNNLIMDKDSLLISQYATPPNILNLNTLYFWRVNAHNIGGPSNWSSVFVFRSLVTGINQITGVIPDSYKLYENFPNPFNPVTEIRFDIPTSSIVRITIFNSVGKEIHELVNEELNAGEYRAQWNANEVSSGVYFYKLTAGDFQEVKRMILVK
jgi:hypothetical protein